MKWRCSMNDNNVITLGSLFDGIGGFPYAAARLGIKPIWASEIIPACISITKRHFPNMKHLGDIANLNGGEIEPVDIITFGSPCQGLSLAGRRKGFKDGRSNLFFEAVRIIKEMRNATNELRPRFCVWENVPGVLSSNKNEDFKIVLEEISRIAEPGVSIPRPSAEKNNIVWLPAGAVMGYNWSLAWRTLDAQYWGVPQRRRRIFLVADFGGRHIGEILFKPEILSGDFETCNEKREGTASNTKRNIETAVINDQGGCSINIEASGISPCLRGGAHGNTPIAAQYAVDFGRTADRIQMNPQTAAALQSEGGGGGAKTGLYCLPVYSYDCRNHVINNNISGTIQSKENGGYSLNFINPIVTFSFQRTDEYKESNVGKTLAERDYKSPTDLIIQDYIIRRLTPLECERLQGFPDNWTACGHTGKSISDSRRYKALGNSVAIPCVERVLGGINYFIKELNREI